MDDEEWWNTSETSARAFSFDDDLLSPQEMLAIGKSCPVGVGASDDTESVLGRATVKPALLPLSSLISPDKLQLLLPLQPTASASNSASEPTESASTTLRRLVLRRRCSLHIHRTLASKTLLLDGAIALGDGDAILVVVLYLIQSLQRKIVYGLLSSRPVALNHYISFLLSESKISELTDLLTMLGKSPEAAMYQYEHAVKSSGNNVTTLLNKMRNLLANHFSQPGIDPLHTNTVASYIKFLEWQTCANIPELAGCSVLQCVAYCCASHWNDTAGKMMSPLTLCQQQHISTQQYDWVALNVHATIKNWELVESLFTRKNWLGKTTMSSSVRPQVMIHKLDELGASRSVLASYINNISNSEQRLQIAKQYKVHSVVTETLVKARDRAALLNYKLTLQPHSEEYFLAENALQDQAIKWKN